MASSHLRAGEVFFAFFYSGCFVYSLYALWLFGPLIYFVLIYQKKNITKGSIMKDGRSFELEESPR